MTKDDFRYEYREDEGLVLVFANNRLVTEMVDEDGDHEACFNWFVDACLKAEKSCSTSRTTGGK